jgi:hypothetical protein
MKRALLLSLVFALLANAATAQKFSLVPQIGIENSRTSLRYNNLPYFLPLRAQLSPHLAIRMDYQFKGGHGPFIGAATSPSVVSYNFSDPEIGNKVFTASRGDLRIRFEGGYRYSSKPIYFSKPTAAKKVNVVSEKIEVRRSCGGYTYTTHCARSAKTSVAQKNRGWFARIQPSIGAAYIPSVRPYVSTVTEGNQSNFKYQAGNWNLALISGVGFELGKNLQRKFSININYLKGLGNLQTQTINATSGTKTTTTNLKSRISSWNLTAGVPITFSKQKTIVKKPTEEKYQSSEGRCSQYRTRCGRMN